MPAAPLALRRLAVAAACGLVAAGLVTAGLAGCGRPDACREALRARRHDEAARLCAAAYAASGDAATGLAAARASYSLGRADELEALAGRLAGSSAEAEALALVAELARQRGEAEAAARAFTRVRELARQAGEPGREAWAAYGLAYLGWEATSYTQALAEALAAERAAARAGDDHLGRLALELQLAVFATVGDETSARAVLARSERLFGPASSPADRARALHFEADLWLETGRHALARAKAEAALATAGDGEEPGFYRALHLSLADLALREGELERARRHLADAAKLHAPTPAAPVAQLYFEARLAQAQGRFAAAAARLAEALAAAPPLDWAWDLHAVAGEVALAQGDRAGAEKAWRLAIAEVEELRAGLGLDELKPWLLAKKRAPFEALVRLLLAAGRGDEALEVAERARARTFLDAFVRGLEAAPRPLVAAATAGLERLGSLETLLPAATAATGAGPRPMAALRRALGKERLLGYFEAEGELWVLPGLETGRWRRLELPSAELAALADRFHGRLDDPELASTLGAALLPSDLLPPAGETLTLVTDGWLASLPFAALRVDGALLVARNPLAQVPSLAAFAALRERRARPAGPSLVLGDPRGDLPGAKQEAELVAARLGVSPHLGSAANRAALPAGARPRLLHLAAHTGLSAGGPWIELADGRLTAAAVLEGRLAPRLAVLATCSSAARPGAEAWGSLAAAFLAAGSETVVAALAAVDDQAARELALGFYAAGGLERPAAALAAAQAALASRGRPAGEWAPFVVMGLASDGEGRAETPD